MIESRLPKRPTATPQKGISCFAMALASALSMGSLSVLFVLSLGYILPVVVVGCVMFAVVGFHYVVWGWWLGAMIHAEEEQEQRSDESEHGG